MVDELEPNEGTVNYKRKAKESDWDRKEKGKKQSYNYHKGSNWQNK